MEELETSVIKYIKEWIHEEKPQPHNVDGPWKIYVKRFQRNYARQITSEGSLNKKKANNALKKLTALNFMSNQ